MTKAIADWNLNWDIKLLLSPNVDEIVDADDDEEWKMEISINKRKLIGK